MLYQRRSYLQCQALNIVMSNAKTPSYTIQWREDAANCNGNKEVFYTASMKINKKCHSATSFSINNDTIDTLPLTYFLSNAIRINSFNLLWSTLSKPLHNSLSATQHMDSTTPKITISKSKYQIQTCNMFQTAVCWCPNLYQQVQCIISSNINLHCHFYLHNLISVNDDALTLIGNKSAIPCRFHLQLL